MNKAQMEKLMVDHELKILKLVNNISFDFTFLYDHSDNSGYIIRQDDEGKCPSHFVPSFREELIKRVHPDDLLVVEKELKHAGQAVPQLAFEVRIKEENGRRYRWHAVRMILLEDVAEAVYVGRTVYIDSRKHKETELTIKARQDPLTGLLNKVVSKENIDNYIKHNPDTECALLVFDIDKFKNFNDTMGHLFGDEVIKECANCLRRAFSKDSFVGRIGGDEFVVFIKDLSDIACIVQRMGKIRDAFSSITLGQRTNIGITCSVGISLYPDMGTDYESLFQCADMALYSVKSRGRNNYAFYTDEIFDESVLERREEKEDIEDSEITVTDSSFDIAVKLLRESDNVSSAINLVLYRIQNDYDLEAIHLYELDYKNMMVECTYEIHKPERPSYLGRQIEFSYKAWKKMNDDSLPNGGCLVFDYADKSAADSGSGVKSWDGVASMFHVDLILFGKNRGCIDYVSSHPAKIWTSDKIDELLKLSNLISICMYYSSKVARAEKAASKYAECDSLTGLMKEEAFIEAATKAISSKANEKKLAVIYSDISNFKYINEAYGYVVGDRILTDMANFISNDIKNVLCAGRFYSDNILFI
ncbi:MAG: diguanylate cyclase [Lachnospiraceae bacterium]|nr:diguanylate cyclase [Lachnospiraceae bacterium]